MAAQILALPAAEARSAAVKDGLRGHQLDPQAIATAFAADTVNVGVGKPLLAAMAEWAFDDDCSADDAIAICDAVIKATSRRITAFGEEAVRAREVLADVYECSEQPQNAVNVLLGMPTESGLRSAGDEYKVSLYVRIAELSLDLDNTVQAEAYVKKAWTLVREVFDAELKLRFEACHAKVCDVKRRFLEAAQRFYQLSQRVDDWMDALQKAIVCIVLEDAGPKRSRLIATIFRDERTAACGELGAILGKVYHDRVLREKDVAALDPFLKPHHRAIMRDGRTVFDNAMTQHNLLSASKLYFNISFAELGVLLGVDPERAEEIAAQMAAEDRLPATIDQVNEVINFQSDSAAAVEQWDAQIAAACQSVSLVAEDIARRHPDVAAAAARR